MFLPNKYSFENKKVCVQKRDKLKNNMPLEIITFVTGNHNKVREFVEILGPGISFNVRNFHVVITVIMNFFCQ